MQDSIDRLQFYREVDSICESKNWNKKIQVTLRNWLLSVLTFYHPNSDILEHRSLEKYIKENLDKLKQVEDLKILKLENIIENPNCTLYKCIQKIPSNTVGGEEEHLLKQGDFFKIDDKGEYYLSATGVCIGNKRIELEDRLGIECSLQHELQHINQGYIYPSEFPFAKDMMKCFHEGDAEYYHYLLREAPPILPSYIEDSYEVYYLVYTLLMLAIPKEMRLLWDKTSIEYNSNMFLKIFKAISTSFENRKNFSYLFALATMMVASCNAENTKEIFEASIKTSLNWCSKKVEKWNIVIEEVINKKKKENLEYQQNTICLINDLAEKLKNPNQVEKDYLEEVNLAKEWLEGQPKEEQEKYIYELELFTLEKFESQLEEQLQQMKAEVQNRQNKEKTSLQDVLESKDYCKYNYYQFGIELNENMKNLLKQELTFLELFEKFVEAIENYLIENKVERLEEKLTFIERVKKENLASSKKI